jgi:hypothetical protein
MPFPYREELTARRYAGKAAGRALEEICRAAED